LAISVTANTSDIVLTDGDHAGLAQDGGTSAAGNTVNRLLYSGTNWPQGYRPQPPPTGSGQQSPSPSTTGHTSTTPGLPAGYRWVSYAGLEVAVPKALSVRHSPCSAPVNAVYAANGAGYSCPARPPDYTAPPAPPGAISVWLGASTDGGYTTLPGQRIGHRTVSRVRVTVAAPAQGQIDTILNSIRTFVVDPLGCPAAPASITPSGQPKTAQLVPPGPTSAVVCEFSPIGANHGYRLVGSYRLPADPAALATVIDGLPAGTGTSTGADQYDWIRFGYRFGRTRVVAVPTDFAPAYVTDGERTVVDTNPGVDLLPLLGP
jgi:hypothetical protein